MKFLNPTLLIFLPLASIPFILHLLSRFRLKRIDFSSLFFLRLTKQERFNFYKLREILLLFLRTLFIFTLLFSLARPYFVSPRPSFLKALAKTPKTLALIIDDSYSMQYKDNFSQAKATAKDFLKTLHKKSEISIFLASGKKLIETTMDKKSFDEIITLIDTLRPSFHCSRLNLIFDTVVNTLKKGSFEKEIYLFSDLQENTFQFLTETKIPFPLKIIPFGEETFRNCAISAVVLAGNDDAVNGKKYLKVILQNYGERKETLKVSLKSKNLLESKEVILAPRQKQGVIFEKASVDIDEGISGTVEIDGDSLMPDNLFYFTFDKKDKNFLLVLYEKEEDIFYLKKLLSLEGVQFEVSFLPIEHLKKISLSSYQLVFLVNPTRITRFHHFKFLKYLEEGGSLVLTLANELAENNFSEIFEVEGVWSGNGFKEIAQADTAHPILKGFSKPILIKPKFFRTVKLLGKNLTPLARFSDGSVFIAEETTKNIIIFATNFAPNSTDLPMRTLFLPLIYRTISYLLARSSPFTKDYYIGDTIYFPTTAPSVKVKTPMGFYVKKSEIKRGVSLVSFTETDYPGFYQIDEKKIVVNVNPKEGDLKRIDLKKLEKNGIEILKFPMEAKIEITPILLYLALFFLLGEIILLLF